MYLVFTRMPGESYHRRLRSLLLCLCDVFRALINSLVCWFYAYSVKCRLELSFSRALSLFRSYLYERKQCVIVQNQKSLLPHWILVYARVCSRACPLLYCTPPHYHTSLKRTLPMFTDDTQLSWSASSTDFTNLISWHQQFDVTIPRSPMTSVWWHG